MEIVKDRVQSEGRGSQGLGAGIGARSGTGTASILIVGGAGIPAGSVPFERGEGRRVVAVVVAARVQFTAPGTDARTGGRLARTVAHPHGRIAVRFSPRRFGQAGHDPRLLWTRFLLRMGLLRLTQRKLFLQFFDSGAAVHYFDQLWSALTSRAESLGV